MKTIYQTMYATLVGRVDKTLELEQHPKIIRKVQQSGNRMTALSSLAGVSPPASSALSWTLCPPLLFLSRILKLAINSVFYFGEVLYAAV